MTVNPPPARHTAQPASRDFVSVPNEIIHDHRLSFEARLLYMLLLSYNWQPGKLLPNIDTLQSDMRCDIEALIAFLYELKAHGLLDTYTVLYPQQFAEFHRCLYRSRQTVSRVRRGKP